MAVPPPPTGEDLRQVLAWHLKRLRIERGWSQEDLALACELDRTYVSAVERSVWNVSLSNIEKLAQALGVQAWELLVPPSPPASSNDQPAF